MSTLTETLATLTGPGGPFEVVTEPVNDIETRVYKQRMQSLRELVNQGRGHGDRDALVQGDSRHTFAELAQRISSVAAGLLSIGVDKGDRVAIIAANSPDWLVTFWATVSIGAVSVPLNAWWKAEELEFALDDCKARVAVCDKRRWDVISPLAGRLPSLTDSFVLDVAGDGAARPFAELVELGRDQVGLPDVAVDEDDYCALLYTSGTTGKPKGSIQTHRGTIANLQNLLVRGMAMMMSTAQSQSSDDADKPKPLSTSQNAMLCVVPMFHVTGLFTQAVPAMVTGAKMVFVPPGKFDPDVAMQIIEHEQITMFTAVPTVIQRVLGSPNFGKWELRTLSQIGYGGAPSSRDLTRQVAEMIPWLAGGGPMTAYGMTETAGVLTATSGAEYLQRPGSCGVALATIDIRIVGPDGQDVSAGERGEIWAKGPTVSPGYWDRPEANATTFSDGWLHTGDIARVDSEGYVFILDRAKDMIIRGGENVYCAEVEDIIDHHPNVLECAVVGAPNEDLGEEVKAIVVPVDGVTLAPTEMTEFCAQHLAHYKVPTIWEIREAHLPRNPAGKVLKHALRGHESVFEDDDIGSDAIL